jgi:hypothetical protein
MAERQDQRQSDKRAPHQNPNQGTQNPGPGNQGKQGQGNRQDEPNQPTGGQQRQDRQEGDSLSNRGEQVENPARKSSDAPAKPSVDDESRSSSKGRKN